MTDNIQMNANSAVGAGFSQTSLLLKLLQHLQKLESSLGYAKQQRQWADHVIKLSRFTMYTSHSLNARCNGAHLPCCKLRSKLCKQAMVNVNGQLVNVAQQQ